MKYTNLRKSGQKYPASLALHVLPLVRIPYAEESDVQAFLQA
jgi:hypothetical protein